MGRWLMYSLLSFSILAGETNWVKYGWQIFQNAGDARTMALGNTQIASEVGAMTFLLNPANFPGKLRRSLTYAHQSRFGGIVNSDLIAFPLETGPKRPLGFTLLYEGVSGIPDTRNALIDLNGNGVLDENERLDPERVQLFSQNQWAASIATFWDRNGHRVGVSVKGLFHSLGEHFGSGFGLDLGYFHTWKGVVSAGIVIRDVTTSWLVWDNGSVERTAPTIAGGLYREIRVPNFPLRIGLMSDVVVRLEGRSTGDDFSLNTWGGNIRSGAELTYKQRLNLRFGRSVERNTSAGLGLEWEHFQLDYAYRLSSAIGDVGRSHFISFALDPKWFSEQVDRFF